MEFSKSEFRIIYLFISDEIMSFSNPFTISVRVRRPAPRSEGKA